MDLLWLMDDSLSRMSKRVSVCSAYSVFLHLNPGRGLIFSRRLDLQSSGSRRGDSTHFLYNLNPVKQFHVKWLSNHCERPWYRVMLLWNVFFCVIVSIYFSYNCRRGFVGQLSVWKYKFIVFIGGPDSNSASEYFFVVFIVILKYWSVFSMFWRRT